MEEKHGDEATWPTIAEVSERTGLSERTLYRRIGDGLLRTVDRRIPGRKPVVAIHPEDAERLEAATAKPIPPIPAPSLPAKTIKPTGQDVAALLATALTQPTVKITDKLMLSIDEAAAISGLSKAYLQRAIKGHVLPAIRDRGWKIRRRDLEKYVENLTDM